MLVISTPVILNIIVHRLLYSGNTVEPPSKGHVGDNINLAVLSFIERLFSFRGSQCI